MLTARDGGEDPLPRSMPASMTTSRTRDAHPSARPHRDRRATRRSGRRPLARRVRARPKSLAGGVGELAIALQHEINNPLASLTRTRRCSRYRRRSRLTMRARGDSPHRSPGIARVVKRLTSIQERARWSTPEDSMVDLNQVVRVLSESGITGMQLAPDTLSTLSTLAP